MSSENDPGAGRPDERAPAFDPSEGDRTAEAGEYVLGTLAPAERAAFAARLENDGALQRTVAFWRDRLGPLDDVAASIDPPPDLWRRIADTLPPPVAPPANDNLRALRRSRNLWRGAAIAAALLAVTGAAVAVSDDVRERVGLGAAPVVADGGSDVQAPALGGREYVAVVNRDGSLPALVINVDGASGEVSVRALDMPRPAPDESYQVWYVPPGGEAVSVGLMDGGVAQLAEIEPAPGATIAISQERRGGSATGRREGPVMFSGTLVEVPGVGIAPGVVPEPGATSDAPGAVVEPDAAPVEVVPDPAADPDAVPAPPPVE